MIEELKSAYFGALDLLDKFCKDDKNIELTATIAEELAKSINNGNKVLICGNGGSTCDAMHFAEELTGRYRKDRRPLPAMSLSDPAHITCCANDYGYESIFERGVEAFGKPGDWLICLSTSGNSKNIILAIEKAKSADMKTLALLGKGGGEIKGGCDYEFVIDSNQSERIQEIHMMILHMLVEGIERKIFPEHYS